MPSRESQKLRVDGSAAAYECEKYVTNLENLRSTLDQFGVAILPALLNAEEVQRMNDGMWSNLNEMTSKFSGGPKPIDRNKKNTWPGIEELKPMHGFLIQNWGIGHAKYVWDLRANPKVCEAFATVHQTRPEELLTSYDAVSILLPDGKFGKTRTSSELWLHTDQRFNYEFQEFRYSVQSWVTGYDVEDGCATLAFLEGSHKYHAEFGKKCGMSRHGFDWYQLDEEAEYKYLNEECGCPLKAIRCPAGSLVLFDSRIFHSGMAPPSGCQSVPRHVAYICMTPRSWCREHDLIKRKEYYLNGRMTPHTPHVPRTFSHHPRGHGKDSIEVVAPTMYKEEEMTERMKTLVPMDVQIVKEPEEDVS